MKVIEKPWGKEEVLEVNDKYMVKRLTMLAGHRCSLQYHEKKHETIYVLSGKLGIVHGKEEKSLKTLELVTGDFLSIEARIIHRMMGIEDCVYLEASTPELTDVVRLVDDYDRK